MIGRKNVDIGLKAELIGCGCGGSPIVEKAGDWHCIFAFFEVSHFFVSS